MRVLAASLLVAATLLQGCTLLGIASTTASISSPKHGWFDVNAKLVEKSELRRPAVPLNLTLHLRVIVQGIDTGKEGTLEDSFEWLFADETRKEMVDLLEKNGIALITDRGLDGAVYIEISDTMEDIGMRYLPIIPTVRWTERKIGKMRITFINSANHKVSSTLTEENVFIQSGLLSDSPQSEYKKKPSRTLLIRQKDGITTQAANSSTNQTLSTKLDILRSVRIYSHKGQNVFI